MASGRWNATDLCGAFYFSYGFTTGYDPGVGFRAEILTRPQPRNSRTGVMYILRRNYIQDLVVLGATVLTVVHSCSIVITMLHILVVTLASVRFLASTTAQFPDWGYMDTTGDDEYPMGGGMWDTGITCGLFMFHCNGSSSYTHVSLGFRAAISRRVHH